MFAITQSLVQARGRAVTIIIYYCGSSGSSAKWNGHASKVVADVKLSRMVSVSKWHSKISHASNTFVNYFALKFTIFNQRDPLAADDGSRKHSTTLERRRRGNNEFNDATVREFRTGAGGRRETSNLIVVA